MIGTCPYRKNCLPYLEERIGCYYSGIPVLSVPFGWMRCQIAQNNLVGGRRSRRSTLKEERDKKEGLVSDVEKASD